MYKITFSTLTFFLILHTLIAQPERLTPEILWTLNRVGLEDVSADGQLTIYGTTHYSLEENKGYRDLVLHDGTKTTLLTQTKEKEYNAQFVPGTNKIAYLRSGELWLMNRDGSKQQKVSDIEMNGFKIAPDGKKLLFIQDVKYDKTVNELYPDLPKADARIMDGLMYRHWDSWHDYAFSNIFALTIENGVPTGSPINIQMEPFDAPLKPFGGMEQINWSPDGRYIAYTCKKESGTDYALSTNSDIYLFDLLTQKTTNVSAPNKGYDLEPVFSPDGKYLAWNSMETPGFEADRNRIILYDLASKKSKELTKGLDYSANHPQWSADSKKLFFTSYTEATNQLFELPIADPSQIKQLTVGVHDYYGFIVRPNHITASRASMSAPHELYRISLPDYQVEQLTEVNGNIDNLIQMGKVEKVKVPTTDGKEMLVWMIYPPNFDPNKKYPALLYCQGGPQSTVSQFWSYRWNFQMMAANDYIVIAPNRRGLPGFGREWNDQISGDWGGQAMQDLLSATDYARELPYVDADRMGAVGASFGGYSVYWLAGNHQGRFSSFIAHCGVFNLESWYGTTEELFFANQDMQGAYWQSPMPETYRQDSPHRYVQNWDTPILVIHNEKDFRVPISEGMQAFQAAQLQGIKSKFLYFPEENHWVLSPQNSVLWQRVFFSWLHETLNQKP